MKHSADITPCSDGTIAAEAGLAWRVVGAAVPGASHLRLDMPCQDAQAARVLPSGDLLVALADGAGSARQSDQGAARAVEEALAALATGLESARPDSKIAWEQLLQDAFDAARRSVLQIAEDAFESPREFAATLTIVVVTGDRLAAGQIGDGAVVGIDENGAIFTATRLQRGEYANETHFITQDDALEQAVIAVIERPVHALAVMSDGLIRLALKMPSQEPHEPFFQPLFRFASAAVDPEEAADQLALFLGSERVNSRTDDDKALVLAVRAPALTVQAAKAFASPASEDRPGEREEPNPLNGSAG